MSLQPISVIFLILQQSSLSKPLIQKFPHSPSLQTPQASLTVMSPSASPSLRMFSDSLRMTSLSAAEPNKTTPSPVREIPTPLLLHRLRETKATSLWMSMPVSRPMLPATASPQPNSAKPLTQKHLSSTSPQTPQIPLTGNLPSTLSSQKMLPVSMPMIFQSQAEASKKGASPAPVHPIRWLYYHLKTQQA